MEHEEYMRQALELARLAMAEGEVPVGCVIVRDGAVVGRGRNRRETAQTALGHAELEAIAQACRTLGGWRLAGCALYVTLEPCPMCAGAIVNALPYTTGRRMTRRAAAGRCSTSLRSASTTTPASTAGCWRRSAPLCSRNSFNLCADLTLF